MLINIGNRTDIPAFFSTWFYNRIQEGSVCVRNPYVPQIITRYRLNPDVVDALIFTTKNPAPMLENLDLISAYNQYWFVTITAYGRDIEPGVPPVADVIGSFRELSRRLGQKALVWRYDPVFLGRGYDKSVHIRSSRKIAAHLEGYTQVCIFSFVDLYRKTLRNFPDVQEVSPEDQHELAAAFAAIASDHGMRLKSCAESRELDRYGIDSRGCIMKQDLEDLTGREYTIPGRKSKREACECLLENEIGAYNSCPHGCLYCYANTSPGKVALNFRNHDPESPLLIGHPGSEDEISVPRQKSYADKQLGLF